MTTPETQLPKMGRPKLPASVRRVRLACTVAPETLATYAGIAAQTPGGCIGRVLDALAAAK